MTKIAVYGNRPAPMTSYAAAEVLKALFSKKTLVSLDDMRKATGRKWVRGYLNTLRTTDEQVVAVRSGRSVIGYRLESTKLNPTKNGAVRGPKGVFVKINATSLAAAGIEVTPASL